MSENNQDLAPSPLVGDAFKLGSTRPTTIGVRYLQIAVTFDATLDSFETEIAHWSISTSPTKIASQQAVMAAALQANITAMTETKWPADIQPLCDKLNAATESELAQVQSPPTETSRGLRRWLTEWQRAGPPVSAVALKIRRALHVPQRTPLPESST